MVVELPCCIDSFFQYLLCVSCQVTDSDGIDGVVTSPENGGPNALWIVNIADNLVTRGVVLLSVCSPTTTALTFVDFYKGGDEIARQEILRQQVLASLPEVDTAAPLQVDEEPDRYDTNETAPISKTGMEEDEEVLPAIGNKYVRCDFAPLSKGVFLSDVDQQDSLEHACSFTVSGADADTTGSRQVNVLDTANITNEMWGLGSPHSSCGGHMNVTGHGGQANGPFPNCRPLGKVLFVEEDTKKSGGCLNIDFVDPVDLMGMGILNLPEHGSVRVTVSKIPSICRYCRFVIHTTKYPHHYHHICYCCGFFNNRQRMWMESTMSWQVPTMQVQIPCGW